MIGTGAIASARFLDQYAIQFNGSTQYAYIDNPSFAGNTQGCFAFRLTPIVLPTLGSRSGIIGFAPNTAGNDSFFWISQRYSSAPFGSFPRLELGTRKVNGGAFDLLDGSSTLVAGATISVVVQSNGTTSFLYINGVAQTVSRISGSNAGNWLGDISGATKRLTFGCEWFNNALLNPGNEKMNNALYVSRTLTGPEITEWHNGGTPNNPNRLSFRPDIVSSWRFENNLLDSIGTNHLTPVGSPTYVTP